MATTLLQAVNRVLKRVGEISSASPDLTSLTDSARQIQIDKCVQLWQEAMEYMQGFADLPGDIGSGTITLVTGTREYATASGFQGFVGDESGAPFLVCASPTYRIGEYPGGYKQMFAEQPDPDLYTGQPGSFVYNPVTEMIRLDRTPTSAENGQVFTYLFDRAVTLVAFDDTFPIPDAAVNVLTNSVAEAYKLSMGKGLAAGVWKLGIAEAIRISALKAKDKSYA